MNREIEAKTGRVVELLETEDLGGVLLNAQHNFAWLTGGASNGIDLSRENGAATIFVRRGGKRFLLANNIEMPRMLAEAVSADDFEPIEFSWQQEKAEPDLLITTARKLTGEAIASDIVIHPETRSLESKIASLRFELMPEEIVRFRKLGADAGEALQRVIGKIQPGEGEIEIAAKIRSELAAKDIASVVILVAADERIERFRHPVPTENCWRKTLLLVTCAKRGGLIASLSRMIAIGNVPSELKEKTEAAAFVNAALWNATRPGITGAELYQTAVAAYTEAGFDDEINRHHQGGATGYKTREWVAHPRSSEVVKTSQAFAWNPSITGTKIEETTILSDRGIETITTSPDFPVITHDVDGREFNSPGILSI